MATDDMDRQQESLGGRGDDGLGAGDADWWDFREKHRNIYMDNSRRCDVGTQVPFSGSILNGQDRVNYYKALIEAMHNL